MKRSFKVPRLYSVQFTFSDGRVVNRMLGVACNNTERQRLYTTFRAYEYYADRERTFKAELQSENLNVPLLRNYTAIKKLQKYYRRTEGSKGETAH